VQLARQLDPFRAILGGTDDLDVRAKPEHELQTFAEDPVVLDQDDANRRLHPVECSDRACCYSAETSSG